MRKLAVLFLVILVIISVLGYDYTIKDLGTASRLSKIQDKLLLINFSSPSCYYCQKFEKEVLPDEEVQKVLRGGYIYVKIEPTAQRTTFMGKSYSNNELFSAFGVRGTPTFVFLYKDKVITQVPGFMPASDYLKALRYLLRYVYDNIKESFEVYSKRKDDYYGKTMVVNVSKDDADFVLKNEKNAISVDKVPEKIDVFTTYVTRSKEAAQALNKAGVIRVLLVK